MSRPTNWQKRYEAMLARYNRLYTRFTKLQDAYVALKHKKAPEPLTHRWRRMMWEFLE
jgi:hypothetical protein